MLRQILSTIAFSALTAMAADRGTVTGVITATEAGRTEALPFVNVAIKGTAIGGTTDLEGRFSFTIEPGTYVIQVSFVGYEPVERTITVSANSTTRTDLELKPRSIAIQEVEVSATRRTETESAVVMEARKSEQVVNGVGREQIAKGQDRTAGDVVKRIPGVTMVGDRFIMIRGLADRYNTVLLNDVMAPSLEPDKRAFSFDVLPSGALDRVMIYKSGAPELPGEFAGGVIKLYTVNVPDSNSVRVDYSASYRDGTTFGAFNSSQKSSTDWLGYDNGLRSLPSAFPSDIRGLSAQGLQNAGRALSNNWSAERSTAAPDQRFSLLLARRFGNGDARVRGGNITSISYSSTRLSYTAKNYNYNVYDPAAGRSDSIYNYSDNENIAQSRVSALSNFSLLLGSRSKLELRNLFTQQGTDQATLRTGRNFEEQFEVKNYAFRYQQRTIYSGQLHGSHELQGGASKLEWTAGYGRAWSKEPDFRRIRTVRDINTEDADTPFQTIIPPGATTLDAGRFFSNMAEEVKTGRIDFERKLEGEHVTAKIRAGAYAELKDRAFEARWMSFRAANLITFDQSLAFKPLDEVFAPENINGTTGFKLEEGTNPSDRYTASNALYAAYLGGTVTINTSTTISAGARAEHNTQQLQSRTFGGRRVLVDNPVLSILPSLGASRQVTERAQVRLAYASTVNRPEFRELAPFAFYDFSFNNVLRGNDSLKVATVQNLDARYEFYPAAGEVISAGVFYKRFTDPIEMFFLPGAGSGGTRNFTFGNARSATSVGAEVEVRRSLNTVRAEGVLSRLGVMLNAAYIVTRVDLGKEAAGQQQQRPLMGQSPYIVNAGLYYQDRERQLQGSILYNVIGPRLFAVGTYGTPDIHEMPRNAIDVAVTKGLGKRLDLKLAAQDILNQRVLLVQDSDGNGRIGRKDEQIMSFRRGAYFTVGLSARF